MGPVSVVELSSPFVLPREAKSTTLSPSFAQVIGVFHSHRGRVPSQLLSYPLGSTTRYDWWGWGGRQDYADLSPDETHQMGLLWPINHFPHQSRWYLQLLTILRWIQRASVVDSLLKWLCRPLHPGTPALYNPSLWVWTGLSNLLLINRIWQTWWHVISEVRLYQDCDFCLVGTHSPSPSLSDSVCILHSCSDGEGHVARIWWWSLANDRPERSWGPQSNNAQGPGSEQ